MKQAHRSDGLAFAGSGLDRAAHLRGDAAAMATMCADAAARVLPLWRAKPLLADAARDTLGWQRLDAAGLEAATEPPLFLGLDAEGPRFALDLSAWEPDGSPVGPLDGFLDITEQMHPAFGGGARFAELRGCMTRISAREAELAATARALVGWHARHRFCANCGAATVPTQAGWQRDCAACGASHYPRTDPVAIMLITHGNRVLVGRSPGWPQGMYSLLAGFVEPGETLEAAVRREVFEEAGIRVGRVEYVLSQPWPFPASLMLACRGEALDEAITVDPAELEDARWVTREEMMTVFAGTHPDMTAARAGAVARHVLELWLADRLHEPAPCV
jgi:NAD+ diphosphatase